MVSVECRPIFHWWLNIPAEKERERERDPSRTGRTMIRCSQDLNSIIRLGALSFGRGSGAKIRLRCKEVRSPNDRIIDISSELSKKHAE